MLAAAAFVCLGELLADSWLGRRYSLRYLTRHQLMELTHKVSLVGPLVDPLVGPLVGPRLCPLAGPLVGKLAVLSARLPACIP